MWLFAPPNVWRRLLQSADSDWRPRRDLNPCYRRERHPVVTNRNQRHGSQQLERKRTLWKSYRTLIEPSARLQKSGRAISPGEN